LWVFCFQKLTKLA